MQQKEENKEQPPKIYIAMACYDSVKINTMLSVTRLVKEFTKAGLEWQIETVKSPYVSKARNALTALFLRSKYDYLLFIDADVEFNPEAVIRMLVTKKDIILTPYRVKFPQDVNLAKYSVSFPDDKNVTILPGDLVEISEGPAGLMLIHRKVFEFLMDSCPRLKIKHPFKKESDPYLYNFWDTTFDMDQGLWRGEDISFCRLARDYGFKIYANIKSRTTHHGSYGWPGKFEDALAKENK
jgi:glycosyltransferase involved in cell wall biosynthesis